jgi:hypothetical protein
MKPACRAAAVLLAAAALSAVAVPAASASVAPRPLPLSAYNPAAKRLACGTSCYHIQEKNGGQFMAGFNSDQAGYWLRSAGTFDARDIILAGVSQTCSNGSGCFEAKMLTVNNLEVVTETCVDKAGNTFDLVNTTGTTGDVYLFVTYSNGDNAILSRACNDKVSFQNSLGAPMQLGDLAGEYWRVLYFPGT